MKLPKSLETVRYELLVGEGMATSAALARGFDAGVSAVLQSAELNGLIKAVQNVDECEKDDKNVPLMWTALERWQKWVKE